MAWIAQELPGLVLASVGGEAAGSQLMARRKVPMLFVAVVRAGHYNSA